MFNLPKLCFVLAVITFGMLIASSETEGQSRKKDDRLAVMRGKIAYDKNRVEAWNGDRLVIPYGDIDAKIREKVQTPLPPYPAEWKKWNRAQLLQWEKNFIATDAGKRFLENRKKLLDDAAAFDVKFEKDGTFVIYDVPPGTYGIQGRTDREIGETNYGFEVFGEVTVLEEMEEIILDPIRVEVTPLLRAGQKAPPLSVTTHNDKAKLTLDMEHFQGNLTFVNFWSVISPTAMQEQRMVQDMFSNLKDKYGLRLLSVNIDEDRKKVLQFVIKNNLRAGRHGFTVGVDHKTLFDFGVRSFPSFWLIDKDGTIKMSQYDIARMMRLKPDLETIIKENIEGKDAPTPAGKPPEEGGSEK